jgi:hypothetical protein
LGFRVTLFYTMRIAAVRSLETPAHQALVDAIRRRDPLSAQRGGPDGGERDGGERHGGGGARDPPAGGTQGEPAATTGCC